MRACLSVGCRLLAVGIILGAPAIGSAQGQLAARLDDFSRGLAALVTDLATPARRATAVGVFSAMFLVGNTAGAFFFGWVAHVAGYAVMWSALTVLLTIGGALSTRLARPPSRGDVY